MKTIALFLNHPKCSVQSGNGIIKALHPHYKFKIFTKHEVEDDFFDDVDMVCFPGGFGDSDSWDILFKTNGSQILRYIENGGRYLGICMGAYWADKDYFNIMSDLRVEQYIRQPNTDTKRPHAKEMKVIWNNNPESLYFYDGSVIIGDESKFETVSRYANGIPMAIIQNKIGLIGCHPEAEKYWYDSYSWMKKHWKGSKHHLLLNFVNTLMEK